MQAAHSAVKVKTTTGKSRFFRIKENIGLYIMLVPSVILLCLFAYRPMYGILMAFQNYRFGPIVGAPWADPWYSHFQHFFTSPRGLTIIRNTIMLSGYNLIAGFPFPIIVAVCLNHIHNRKFKRTYQTISYLPHFISAVVMVALIMIILDPMAGLMSQLYRLIFGADTMPPHFMASASAFPHVFVWTEIWQHTGWHSIIYFAALASIDPTLYEAATVDGASRWQKIRYVDIPMILPTASILLILAAGGIMTMGFEKPFLMQNNLNISTSEIIPTYIYSIGLLGTVPRFSYATAVGLFQTVVNLILLLSVNFFAKKMGTGLW